MSQRIIEKWLGHYTRSNKGKNLHEDPNVQQFGIGNTSVKFWESLGEELQELSGVRAMRLAELYTDKADMTFAGIGNEWVAARKINEIEFKQGTKMGKRYLETYNYF